MNGAIDATRCLKPEFLKAVYRGSMNKQIPEVAFPAFVPYRGKPGNVVYWPDNF
jgi:hypothetical protein